MGARPGRVLQPRRPIRAKNEAINIDINASLIIDHCRLANIRGHGADSKLGGSFVTMVRSRAVTG